MSNEGTLDDLYLEWLYENFVGATSNKNPNTSYWELAKQLYTMPFTWVIQKDSHRAEDGKALRDEFINARDIQDVEIEFMQFDCNVLEMLIGLAVRASFEDGQEPGDWFWIFIRHLDLQSFNDRIYNQIVREEVDAIVRRLLDREYDKNGVGGLFPLEHATQDQTQVELWYQLQAFMLEHFEDAS